MLRVFDLLTKTFIGKGPLVSKKCSGSKPPPVKKKFAVILSGSGMLDGTEIHEASAVVIHLTKLDIEPLFYAPHCLQGDVMDHIEGTPTSEIRCALTEAARIARGKISPLNNLQASEIDAVVFPGGFGVAKTLSTFASNGASCSINGEVLRIMNEFHDLKKPMGFMCISAILPARIFPCVKITMGKKGDAEKWPHSFALEAATQMGAELEARDVDGFTFDKDHLIFSTPAFMYEGTFHEIFFGIGNMIENMYKTMK